MEGRPNDVFFSNYEQLRSMKLKPPIITQLSAELHPYGFPKVANWSFFARHYVDEKAIPLAADAMGV